MKIKQIVVMTIILIALQKIQAEEVYCVNVEQIKKNNVAPVGCESCSKSYSIVTCIKCFSEITKNLWNPSVTITMPPENNTLTKEELSEFHTKQMICTRMGNNFASHFYVRELMIDTMDGLQRKVNGTDSIKVNYREFRVWDGTGKSNSRESDNLVKGSNYKPLNYKTYTKTKK